MSEAAQGWFSDEGFWTAYASLMFDEGRWAEVPDAVDAMLGLSGLAAPTAGEASVLDMCCGPGRHALEFSRRGYRVTGVDITEPYLDAARDTAAHEGLSAEFIRGDARSWVRPGTFDLALNLFTSFGYFDSPEEDLAMLSCLRRSLKPGGALIMDLVGKESAARNFMGGEWFERDGKLILTEFSVVGAWEGLKNRWVIVDGDKKTDRSWVQRLYSARELGEALGKARFGRVDFYGSLAGAPYDQNAKSLVALARA